MKRPTTISSANGAVPYQPRATPWVCPPIYHQPCQGEPSPIKAENPCNRASSRHIKASAQKHPSPWSLVVLWSLEVGIWSFPAPSPLRLCVKNPAIVLNQGFGPILFTTVTAMHGVVIFKLPLRVVVTAVNRIALQGLSRQTMKYLETMPSSANGAAPYQPRATPWVYTPYGHEPRKDGPSPNQGRKPL